ncbi:MAG TPA: hypothetical protein VGO34_12535 [Alphaproteobacteria bacterium]|jgi:hypothetical protein
MAFGSAKIPKIREHAELTLSDGQTLAGHVFIDATSRIQDLLNSEPRFFPFIDDKNQIHLINKAWVMLVRPYDK